MAHSSPRVFPLFERSKRTVASSPESIEEAISHLQGAKTEGELDKGLKRTRASGEQPSDNVCDGIPSEKRQRMNRNRLVALAKQASKKALAIVQSAQKEGKLPALQSLVVEESWKSVLAPEFERQYFRDLERFEHMEIRGSTPIYPPMEHIFRAFNSSAFEDVKVVILGQDPYHGENQAMGLSFSVPKGVPLPSSLQNIFKELKSDLGIPIASHGDLSSWSAQGVLLLNTVLSVRARQPNSHQKKGWEV